MTTYSALAPAATRPAAPPLTILQKVLLLLGAVLFDGLFWEQRAALNMLLFTLFVVAAVLAGLPRHAPQWRSGYFWLTLGGTALSALMVAVYGSSAALLACWASLTAWLGYVNQPKLKLVGFALLTGLGNVWNAADRLLQLVRVPHNLSGQMSRSRYYGRLLLLPLGALLLFHFLFVLANPRYAAFTGRLLTLLGNILTRIFAHLSVPHLLFMLLGLLLTAGALLILPLHFFTDQESAFGEFVRRQRDRVASFAVPRPDFRTQTFRVLDLRKEYQIALAMLALVNLLLLVVNAIDIRWLWFGFVPAPGFDLTQFVHEGTYVLILSILVAMAIVLRFFRRNLNFYQAGLPALRWAATIWIVQNMVLAGSVGLRNYYYIVHTGLAYKRIGVYGFLLLTLFGLITILLKIWQQRSAYSLVRLNTLAAYAVMLLFAVGNWEAWMVRYNLQPRFRQVDYGFLLDMPDRILPQLAAREASLTGRALNRDNGYGRWETLPLGEARYHLHARIRAFQAQQGRRSWLSYTWADYQAARYFDAHPATDVRYAAVCH
ncbi:DUF4173 domain-containing protein [Hymenobacter sp. BT175]|uniref:DUF4153 domain-containing protein n=1 Tax=Hymenobacter translucens TaxID=2886507 RepID=UPI001D0F3A54|nr:DUF4173 domain-containing protein [Hymenobacter translucens]MCC2546923.1 DUF4173 domain-containing protein [Hymenobacter translucens]